MTAQIKTYPQFYFNHASCSFTTASTSDATVNQLRLEQHLGNAVADQLTSPDKRSIYQLAARTIGAAEEAIALLDSHTTGWEKALGTVTLTPGDMVLTTRSEWGGNLRALRHLAKRFGASVIVVPATGDGSACLKSLAGMINDRVKLISVSWIGSNGGHIEPVAEIGELARANGIPYFVDASQVVGQIPVDVQQIQCDVLTTPGRKWLRGPKGTGFMYLRPKYLDKCQASSRFDELLDPSTALTAKHFEASSPSVPLQMGLRAALAQLQDARIQQVRQQVLNHSQQTWEGLRALPGVTCVSQVAPKHGLVSFTVAGKSATIVRDQLMALGVEVAANQAAFTPLDMGVRRLDAVVRASPHACTTSCEIDHLIQAVKLVSQGAS